MYLYSLTLKLEETGNMESLKHTPDALDTYQGKDYKSCRLDILILKAKFGKHNVITPSFIIISCCNRELSEIITFSS